MMGLEKFAAFAIAFVFILFLFLKLYIKVITCMDHNFVKQINVY